MMSMISRKSGIMQDRYDYRYTGKLSAEVYGEFLTIRNKDIHEKIGKT